MRLSWPEWGRLNLNIHIRHEETAEEHLQRLQTRNQKQKQLRDSACLSRFKKTHGASVEIRNAIDLARLPGQDINLPYVDPKPTVVRNPEESQQ